MLYTKEEVYDVKSVIEHYETVEVEVPKQRIIGYEYPDPDYIDLGNGYFDEISYDPIPIYEDYTDIEEQEVPIYVDVDILRTKYYYETDQWLYERTVTTSGNDKNPYCGNTNLSLNERKHSKMETYTIIGLVETEKQQSINLSFEDWNSLEVGQTVKIKVSLGYGEIVE